VYFTAKYIDMYNVIFTQLLIQIVRTTGHYLPALSQRGKREAEMPFFLSLIQNKL